MKITRLSQNFELVPDEEAQGIEDAKFDAKYAREKHITELIRQAFVRCGLAIDAFDSYPILYEEDGREARVSLDDVEIPLSKLMGLSQSGLSNDYTITISGSDGLDIIFIVRPELDQAK